LVLALRGFSGSFCSRFFSLTVTVVFLLSFVPYALAPPPAGFVRMVVGFGRGIDSSALSGFGGRVVREIPGLGAAAVMLPEKALERLRDLPGVRYVEPDLWVTVVLQDMPWGVDRIDAEMVHPSTGGEGVVVAIVDTGVDYNHPDLIDNFDVAKGYDFVNGDDDPMDDHWHGTHCAGIVAADDNDFGVVGVAPGATLLAVKVLDSDGGGWSSDVAAGISWAASNGANVISMSLGSDSSSSVIQDACQSAYLDGVVLVAAAGNDYQRRGRREIDTVDYPARYDSVIAVGATAQNDKRASFSSTGADMELAAPGENIYSTVPGGYGIASGTSMACPHVAGTAALVMASNPGMGHIAVRDLLVSTAEDLGDEGWDTWYGYGLVDAYAAAGATDTEPPAQVQGVTVTTVSSTQLDLSWSPNSETDLDHYNIYRGTSSGVIGSKEYAGSSLTISFSDTALEPETTYYYQVTAVDVSGNEGAPSVEVWGITDSAPQEPPAQQMVLDVSISIESRNAGKNLFVWALATVTVVAADSSGPVGDAMVYGHWEQAATGTDSGLTDDSGMVIFKSESVKNPQTTPTFVFVVDDVVKDGWVYDP